DIPSSEAEVSSKKLGVPSFEDEVSSKLLGVPSSEDEALSKKFDVPSNCRDVVYNVSTLILAPLPLSMVYTQV
uniref:hypothetical protein n=1 Tax=Nostoc piscinale TaxID=224012 RepID=UPI0039A70D98